ncbi:unnamed protein product [Brassica oleracea]
MASYKLYFTDLRPLERDFLGSNVPSNLKKAGELIGVDMVRALIRCSSIGSLHKSDINQCSPAQHILKEGWLYELPVFGATRSNPNF